MCRYADSPDPTADLISGAAGRLRVISQPDLPAATGHRQGLSAGAIFRPAGKLAAREDDSGYG
jgi:hypothetical protein